MISTTTMMVCRAAFVVGVIIALSYLLTGCATGTQTVEIRVPVPVPCKVVPVEIQALPVDALTEQDDIFTITKSLWASVELQKADIGKLQAAVEACQ